MTAPTTEPNPPIVPHDTVPVVLVTGEVDCPNGYFDVNVCIEEDACTPAGTTEFSYQPCVYVPPENLTETVFVAVGDPPVPTTVISFATSAPLPEDQILPETGGGVELGVAASLVLLVGILATRIARRTA
jgi:hypothetical protein